MTRGGGVEGKEAFRERESVGLERELMLRRRERLKECGR